MKNFKGEKNPRYLHGLSDGAGYRHPVYTTWQNMKARCLNKNHARYHRYGGRGIKIADEWFCSKTFSEWAFSNGWSEGLTIDRICNDGDYTPANCRWISKSQNSKKKSTTKLTFAQAEEIRKRCANGEKQSTVASDYNVTDGTVWFIVENLTHLEDQI